MNNFRKLLSCIIVLCLVLSATIVPAGAVNLQKQAEISIAEISDRVQSFIAARKGNAFNIERYKELVDEYGSVIAYCYFLEPAGYIIIDTNAEVTEAAFENTASYRALVSQNDEIYYGGPLNYFTKESQEYNDIVTNEKMQKDAAVECIKNFDETVRLAKQEKAVSNFAAETRSTITTNKLPGKLRKYSYNTGVICGSTAAAIMLMYYRDNIDSWVVPSWHDTETGESLIELIRPQINGDPPHGAVCSDVVRGLNYYFRWRGISNKYSSKWTSGGVNETTYNAIKSLINSKRPAEILINQHPTYKNHFVVAHGVEKEIHGSTYYFVYAGDGWGSNDVLISFRYLRQYAYIVG